MLSAKTDPENRKKNHVSKGLECVPNTIAAFFDAPQVYKFHMKYTGASSILIELGWSFKVESLFKQIAITLVVKNINMKT